MKYISILIFSLVIFIPNVIAVLNEECNGIYGICLNDYTCSNYGGKIVKSNAACSDGTICCQDIMCIFNDVQGECMFSYECDDEYENMVFYECPGKNNFKCCLTKRKASISTTSENNELNKDGNSNSTNANSIGNSNVNVNNINIQSQDKNSNKTNSSSTKGSNNNYLFYALLFIGGCGFIVVFVGGANIYIKSKENKIEREYNNNMGNKDIIVTNISGTPNQQQNRIRLTESVHRIQSQQQYQQSQSNNDLLNAEYKSQAELFNSINSQTNSLGNNTVSHNISNSTTASNASILNYLNHEINRKKLNSIRGIQSPQNQSTMDLSNTEYKSQTELFNSINSQANSPGNNTILHNMSNSTTGSNASLLNHHHHETELNDNRNNDNNHPKKGKNDRNNISETANESENSQPYNINEETPPPYDAVVPKKK